MIWQFSSNGVYSTQSLYKVINFRGIQPVVVPSLWSIKVPPRVHYFLWLLSKNKFLLEIILERGWKLRMAPVFSVVRRHLFSEYGVATQLWFVLSHIFKFQLGCSLLSIGQYWLSDKKNGVLNNIVTSTALWSLWKLRNSFCFQNAS